MFQFSFSFSSTDSQASTPPTDLLSPLAQHITHADLN